MANQADGLPRTNDDKDNEVLILKEHEKLNFLLAQIPKKAQHGLMKSCDLVLTCIDATKQYIALGTNIGLTYVYNRGDHSVQKLKAVSTNEVVTSVRLYHGIDDQLAIGTASGDLNIYCIPSTVGQNLPIQKFEVNGLHEHYVTCLEWSTNGMKLYSGDKNGQVVQTIVDLNMGTGHVTGGNCSSQVLLIEPATEIVQLDYKHKCLLVSTRQRSFIVRTDLHCQITSIGCQERKISGPFGATFVPGLCKTEDAQLYASRPGCRLWLADINGVVRNTLIFPDPLSPPVPEISLLQSGRLQLNVTNFQFNALKWFGDSNVVTWSSAALLVLDPVQNKVIARQSRLNGIVDLAVTEAKEIFLLRRHAEARVIRIAEEPETNNFKEFITSSIETKEENDVNKIKETEEEAGVKGFLSKLGNPFKKIDSLFNDSKPSEDFELNKGDVTPAARLANESSPELPPVVRLPYPELDDVRIFTASSLTETKPDSNLVAEAKEIGNIDDRPTDEITEAPSLSKLMSATAALTTVSHITTDPESFKDLPRVESGVKDFSHISADLETDDIVFSHKMKKHKKKKHKHFSHKDKADDTTSLASTSSNVSDDLPLLHTPQNTPASGDTLSTLQRADEILALVNSTLSQDISPSSNPAPDLVIPEMKEARLGFDETDTLTSNTNFETQPAPLNKDIALHTEVYQPTSESNINIPEPDNKEVKKETIKFDIQTTPDTNNDHAILKENIDKIESSLSESDQTFGVAQSKVDSLKSRIDDNGSKDNKPTVDGERNSYSKTGETKELVVKRLKENTSMSDVFKDVEEIEKTDNIARYSFRDADDFYSRFLPENDNSEQNSAEISPEHSSSIRIKQMSPPVLERSLEMQDVSDKRLANSWSEFHTRTNIYSLCISTTHAWYTDKSENIYYSAITGPKGIQWRKATGQASQISVSPSGSVVWRLHKNVVYAGTTISSRHPEGLKWVEAVRDVIWVSADDYSAWYLKKNGDVMMQRGLSAERPFYKSHKVECQHKLKSILCRHGVVWAVTEGLRLVYRCGVSHENPEGTSWELDSRETAPYLFTNVAIDKDRVGWGIDVLGQIWFCVGVTMENPQGSKHWWQVPLSEYVLQEESTMDAIKSLARSLDPMKLTSLLSTNRGGLISAGEQGVWIALDYRNVLHVCRGTMQGFHWLEAHPSQMSASTTWRHVCASISDLEWGLIWAQQSNGDIFVFKHSRGEANMLPDCMEFSQISVGPTAVWAVSPDGDLFVRDGMDENCPHGIKWVPLDMSQFGSVLITHVSCNSLYVWAVESEGSVYQRIGAHAPTSNTLNPVWLPIDTFADIIFTRVNTGPLDWMVWAIDNRRLTYVRAGITELMPIGQEWVHVPGIQAVDLSLTKSGVWALTPQGEVFFRYGISRTRPCGNYWKKIPGTFIRISASANDELWGIDTDGHLMQCSLRTLIRRQESNDPLMQRSLSTGSGGGGEEQDWEMI